MCLWALQHESYQVWAYLKNPRNYGVETCAEVKAIRKTVREIQSHCDTAGIEDWQRWDDEFFSDHLSKADRAREWLILEPIVMAVRNLRLASNYENQVSVNDDAQIKAYEDIEQLAPKYIEVTSWADFK